MGTLAHLSLENLALPISILMSIHFHSMAPDLGTLENLGNVGI